VTGRAVRRVDRRGLVLMVGPLIGDGAISSLFCLARLVLQAADRRSCEPQHHCDQAWPWQEFQQRLATGSMTAAG
jgi:hypothetical protein